MIYLKHNVFLKEDLENNATESVWLEISTLKSKFLIGLFYSPPNSSVDFWNYFEDVLENASDQNMDTYDFNEDIHSTTNNSHLTPIMQNLT